VKGTSNYNFKACLGRQLPGSTAAEHDHCMRFRLVFLCSRILRSIQSCRTHLEMKSFLRGYESTDRDSGWRCSGLVTIVTGDREATRRATIILDPQCRSDWVSTQFVKRLRFGFQSGPGTAIAQSLHGEDVISVGQLDGSWWIDTARKSRWSLKSFSNLTPTFYESTFEVVESVHFEVIIGARSLQKSGFFQ
jgi:hypothetical protein